MSKTPKVDILTEVRDKVAARMKQDLTFYWCRKCECLYNENEAVKELGEYHCPFDGSQLEPEHIREHKTDTMGEA